MVFVYDFTPARRNTSLYLPDNFHWAKVLGPWFSLNLYNSSVWQTALIFSSRWGQFCDLTTCLMVSKLLMSSPTGVLVRNSDDWVLPWKFELSKCGVWPRNLYFEQPTSWSSDNIAPGWYSSYHAKIKGRFLERMHTNKSCFFHGLLLLRIWKYHGSHRALFKHNYYLQRKPHRAQLMH